MYKLRWNQHLQVIVCNDWPDLDPTYAYCWYNCGYMLEYNWAFEIDSIHFNSNWGVWHFFLFLFFFLLVDLRSYWKQLFLLQCVHKNPMLKLILLFIYLFIIAPAQTNGNTISLPIEKANQVKRLQKRSAAHSLQLYNNNGAEYLINIGIGTPIQNFTVSLDTGR